MNKIESIGNNCFKIFVLNSFSVSFVATTMKKKQGNYTYFMEFKESMIRGLERGQFGLVVRHRGSRNKDLGSISEEFLWMIKSPEILEKNGKLSVSSIISSPVQSRIKMHELRDYLNENDGRYQLQIILAQQCEKGCRRFANESGFCKSCFKVCYRCLDMNRLRSF